MIRISNLCKPIHYVSFVSFLFISSFLQAGFNDQRAGFSHTYPKTYSQWTDAFLSGNGKMGIMVFGNPLNETVIFNDRGFNLAKTHDRSFAQVSAADLESIRDNCANGRFEEANKLAVTSSHWEGGGEGNRHPGFAMFITIPENGEVTDYSRTCNYQTGEISVNWTDNRGTWERKAFVSRPDNVTVQYLSAPSKGKLDCSIHLEVTPDMKFPSGMVFTDASNPDYLNLRVHYPAGTNGAGYEGVVKVITSGGTRKLNGNVLTITGATSVILLTRTEKYYDRCEESWNQMSLQKQLDKLDIDYKKLLKKHVAVHQVIYDRVKIDLGADPETRDLPNEDLLMLQKKSSVPVKALWERIFDAGRYYFLSSANEHTPPDLLGIWGGDCNAGWGGFYHLDANLNLQVSSGNIGNMPELMEGYFRLNETWVPDFKTNARKLLGCSGLLACGNTPGTTSGLMANINDYYPYQYATGEEPWLLYPFWEHYLVTGDKDFLRNRLYPLLKEMGAFYEDFLTKTDSNGKYILAGSVSPENQPVNRKVSLLNNSLFDLSGAKFALTILLESSRILGTEQTESAEIAKWKNLLEKLPSYLMNTDGALQEWAWPGLNDNYNHRHSSHLLPVWPYREISPEGDTALFNAAKITLAKKDKFDYGAGHGYLHSALIAACLNNAEAVNNKLLRLTSGDFYFNSLATSHNPKHDIFCTDVCNTVPDVMMEMLVSSSPGILELLPALPDALRKGAVSGILGRNRVTIEKLEWDLDRNTVTCRLRSAIDQKITLIERSGIKDITAKAPVEGSSSYRNIARVITLKAGISTPVVLILQDKNPLSSR